MSTNHTPPAAGEPARDRLDRCHGELVQARRALEVSQQAARRLSDALAELDERHIRLTRLYVALEALYGAQDEDAALAALSEAMVNMAGTEEFAVYELDADGQGRLVSSFGLEPERRGPLSPTATVDRAIARGAAWHLAAPHPPHPQGHPVACVPLRIGDRVAFAVVVWSFLPQKRAFDGFDAELFALLGTHAAGAVRAARLLGRQA